MVLPKTIRGLESLSGKRWVDLIIGRMTIDEDTDIQQRTIYEYS